MGTLTTDIKSGAAYDCATMGAPSDAYYTETLHTIAVNTSETEFGKIVQPIPITFKAFKHLNGNAYVLQPFDNRLDRPMATHPGPQKDAPCPPPKKKWIKEYFEEEPKTEVIRVGPSLSVHSNGVRAPSTPSPPIATQLVAQHALQHVVQHGVVHGPVHTLPLTPVAHDFPLEHSRLRTASTHGPPPGPIPSPPSAGSSGSSGGGPPRAGTREVHNKLEKNRRAHLKECFEMLKKQLPATTDDKKTSNLSILGSAIRYIQVLKRKERECEHELERLAREKIAAQQRLAALKRDASMRVTARPRTHETSPEEKSREEKVNGQVLGIPISIRPAGPGTNSPPHTLNLSTKLRTLPIQITPTTSQNGQLDGVSTLSTTLVHPAQIHLPISQVVGNGGLVVGGAALQLLSAPGLRLLHAPTTAGHNGISTGDSNRINRDNGVSSQAPSECMGGASVMVGGLGPLVVSQPAAHLLHTHTLTHKMVETQVVKGSVAPLTVSAQYLSATAIVKPMVVSTATTPTSTT